MTLTELRRVAEATIHAAEHNQDDLPDTLDAYDRTFSPSTVLKLLDLLDEMAVSVKALRHEVVKPSLTNRERELLLLGVDADLAKYNAWKDGR